MATSIIKLGIVISVVAGLMPFLAVASAQSIIYDVQKTVVLNEDGERYYKMTITSYYDGDSLWRDSFSKCAQGFRAWDYTTGEDLRVVKEASPSICKYTIYYKKSVPAGGFYSFEYESTFSGIGEGYALKTLGNNVFEYTTQDEDFFLPTRYQNTIKIPSNAKFLYVSPSPSLQRNTEVTFYNMRTSTNDLKTYTIRYSLVNEVPTIAPILTTTPTSTPQRQPQLTLTKSISPSTITSSDPTIVTIRVENTGGDARSVKIIDAIPQSFTLISGAATQEYITLKAGESRAFQYTIKATSTGSFVSDPATVIYQDEKSNSYSSTSNSATITVQQPQATPKTPAFESIITLASLILIILIIKKKYR